jgi:hypothetical protein
MDLPEAIRKLKLRREKIELAIAALEELRNNADGDISVISRGMRPNRRGRKSMGPEERQQVANRMKRYWASRRGQ